MSSELAVISPNNLNEAKELASTLANANSMPQALRKSPADVLAIVMAGAELGLAPMQSIRGIVLIEGRPTLSADAMGALVKSSPKCEYLICTETTEKRAVFRTKRKGDPEAVTFEFTIAEAEKAGLTRPTVSGKPSNWHRYPKAMLRARAQSGICRLVYSDLMLGVYDPDELDAPEERDITPKPVASTVVEKTEALKRRLNIVDEVPAPQPSPPSAPLDPATVGWGKNAALRLAELDDAKLRWYVDDAEKKAASKTGDESLTWAAHHARYVAEMERRAVTAPVVAEVTP